MATGTRQRDTGLNVPEDNVEIARAAWEAFSTGDLSAMFTSFAPAAEWHTAASEGVAGGLEVHRGEAEIRRFFAEWRESFDHYEVGVDEFRSAGDRVVALCWQRARARGSQVPIELEWAQILTIRGGRIVRVDNYSDRSHALAMAGLHSGPD